MSKPYDLLKKNISRLDEQQWHEAIMVVGMCIIAVLAIHGTIASLNIFIKPRSLQVVALGLVELCLAATGAWALWHYNRRYEHPYSSIFPRAKHR
jgi:hypothetical protein